MNKLYFGDCLNILEKLHKDHPEGFIDLIYIDPPFNSKRNYNILFESAELKDTKAQKEAFADTWSNISYKDTLEQLKSINLNLYNFLENLDKIGISGGAVSYLTTMAIRIWYIHKVLKDTGSFYLHCDPTMSHYLKIVCDLIFGRKNFRNEIIWHYRRWSNVAKVFQRMHDIILFYSKTDDYIFNVLYQSYSHPEWIEDTVRGVVNGNLVRLKDEKGDYIKREKKNIGVPMHDVWEDINFIGPTAKERLGYPTQKPETLLERIIKASSNESDLVTDFFCGCGTTIAVAERLKRKWLGVDISHLAIGLIERRLINSYGREIKETYKIDGFPKDIASAQKLARGTEGGRLKFQDWIIEAMLGGVHNPKRTADGGWDGHLTFEIPDKKEVVLIEVKSGNVNVKNIREFIQVVNKQNAAMGIFVCFEEQVTKPMLLEAKEQRYYNSEIFGNKYDKIQIITVDDLLKEETIKIPYSLKQTFKIAKKQTSRENKNSEIDFEV